MNDHHMQSTETEDKPTNSQYPDASVFTFIPELYLLLSRLTALSQHAADARTNGHSAHAQDVALEGLTQTPPALSSMNTTSITGSQPMQLSNPLTQTSSRESGTSTTRHTFADLDQSVEIKDLPSHIYRLRQKITHAKEVVSALPDINRTIEEQEQEMARLHRRIAGLNGRVRSLGSIARTGTGDGAGESMDAE